jgi:hypothetical protein
MMAHGTGVVICHNPACATPACATLRNTRALPLVPIVIMAQVVGALCALASATLLSPVTKPSSAVDPALPTQMIARSGRRAPIDTAAVGSIPATPHREPQAAFVADWRIFFDPADIRLRRPFDGNIESRSTPP